MPYIYDRSPGGDRLSVTRCEEHGGLIVNDPAGDRWPILDSPVAEYGMSIAGALFVVILGYLLKRRNASRAAGQLPPGTPPGSH